VTSGRDSGFCITIPHRATHRLYPPDLAPSDFWLFPTQKIGLKGTRYTTMGDLDRMWWPNSGRFPKKPSAGASNNGRINGASVCACKGPTLKMIR
jgi:hypothetical protein